jgi:valyl-tRNA synthetase
LRNVDSIGDFSILNWKEQIPFPAKLQRLYTHKEKAYKKILPVFSQVFFQQHFDAIHKFLVSEKNVQNLLKLFEEKNLWKFKEELVYWDISTQTIVENDAIDWRKETQTQLVVKCFVETKNDIFPLVVDDPMLLFSDVAVMIHNNDKRYKKHLW